jgi:hypothetical protein
MGKSVKEQLKILEQTRSRIYEDTKKTGQGPSWAKQHVASNPGASSQQIASWSVGSGDGNRGATPGSTPGSSQNKSIPSTSASGPNLAQAQREIKDLEDKRLAGIAEDERKKKEQSRFEEVSKAEGQKRRKEFEAKSGASAASATGGEAFLKKEDKKAGTARISQLATARAISPPSAEGTILGLPKDTKVFTKFGESINRAANLTFSAPQTRFGGM